MPRVLNAKETWFDGDGYSPNAVRDGNTWIALAPNAVYVGRPSKWGNPFRIRSGATMEERLEAVDRYREYITGTCIEFDIEELKGKDLVCWCAPLPCHADVLLEIANEE